jgi:hypothetical protein
VLFRFLLELIVNVYFCLRNNPFMHSGTEGDAENEGDGDVGNDRKESSPRKKKCNGIKMLATFRVT